MLVLRFIHQALLFISTPQIFLLFRAKMDDLDSLFEGELASINQVFQEFEVKDKRKEIRAKTEEEDLKQVHTQVSNCQQGGGGGGIIVYWRV